MRCGLLSVLHAPAATVPGLIRREQSLWLLRRLLLEAMRRGKRTHARHIRTQLNRLAGWRPLKITA